MKLFNTLTKKVEKLTPQQDNLIRIYSCGPTVYDHAHIGNLSSYIYADTLRRTIQSAGYATSHTMNITDIDDKTISRSLESNHYNDPQTALRQFTETYTQLFFDDMDAVGNHLSSFSFVKATDYIDNMKLMIKNLVQNKVAYVAEDGVYFSISAYQKRGKKYGQLLHLTQSNLSEQRINNDEYDKETTHDFALWKKRKDNEPYWQFQIENTQLDGRPGWHIECSAMSEDSLGLPFDIHTGGIDLIFPHHENEIAQSTALSTNDIMAKVFFHNEHVLVEGKKMSKSLQNFYTIADIRSRDINPLAFRVLTLQSHYRSQSNFTWENLQLAQSLLLDIQAWADLRFQGLVSPKLQNVCQESIAQIKESLFQDLHTPGALSHLAMLLKKTADIGADSVAISEALPDIESLLGLGLLERQDINHTELSLLHDRAQARATNDWSTSDAVREELKQRGIHIRDTEQGQIWSRL